MWLWKETFFHAVFKKHAIWSVILSIFTSSIFVKCKKIKWYNNILIACFLNTTYRFESIWRHFDVTMTTSAWVSLIDHSREYEMLRCYTRTLLLIFIGSTHWKKNKKPNRNTICFSGKNLELYFTRVSFVSRNVFVYTLQLLTVYKQWLSKERTANERYELIYVLCFFIFTISRNLFFRLPLTETSFIYSVNNLSFKISRA